MSYLHNQILAQAAILAGQAAADVPKPTGSTAAAAAGVRTLTLPNKRPGTAPAGSAAERARLAIAAARRK